MYNPRDACLDTYYKSLEKINGVRFTPREIDIISFIMSGRAAKRIAAFLSLSPKTVENYIHNIMVKVECNSQEGIKDFIEQSGQFFPLRTHYKNLCLQAEFEKILQTIKKQVKDQNFSCLFLSDDCQQKPNFLYKKLERHLKILGINIYKDSLDHCVSNLPETTTSTLKVPIIYKVSESLTKAYQEGSDIYKDLILRLKQIKANYLNPIILLIENEELLAKLPQEFASFQPMILEENLEYYLRVFDILKRILPSLKIDKLSEDFKRNHKSIQDDPKIEKFTVNNHSSKVSSSFSGVNHLFLTLTKNIWCLIAAFFVFSIMGIGLSSFKVNKKVNSSRQDNVNENAKIRTDLSIPIDRIFLKRPELVAQINEKMNQVEDIQTVALVGVGGAGKTTLARYYVRQQKVSLMWEINAQTKDSLRSSFERLASSLATSEEKKKILRGLQEISDGEERKRQLILFVQRGLRAYPNWFLIYDNFEMKAFLDVQSYLPQDAEVWGKGRVIITTRDSTIKNVEYINSQNIVEVKELNQEEVLSLFTKIYYGCEPENLEKSVNRKAKEFLKNIAFFPLDVSTAAHYIKDTQVIFEEYLKRIKNPTDEFNAAQKSLMEEIGDYPQTRYGVITTTLKEIIAKHPDFRDLLFFISLLDSQNIPVDLLRANKSGVVVESLIHHLKKYSLITDFSCPPGINTAFSMHRSTLEISLNYLSKISNLKNNQHLIEVFITLLESDIEQAIDSLNTLKMNLLVAHCKAILSHDHLLTPKLKGVLNAKLGSLLFQLGQDKQAMPLLLNGFAELNKNKNKDYIKLAWALRYLGDFHRYKGEYRKAKQFLNTSLESYKKHAPQNYSKIAWVLVCLANTYWPLGDYKSAKYFLLQCVELYEKHQPKNRNILAWTLTSLGIIHRELGYYEKSKIFLERSLAIYQENPDYYLGAHWALANLGDIHRMLGYHKEAKFLLEKSWRIYQQHYPKNHIRAAPPLIFLGDVYQALGHYETAQNLLEQGYQIYNTHFPQDYIWSAWAGATLANTYRKLGQYKKALNLLEQGLVIYEKHYGKNHTENARILRDIGQVYFCENHLNEAESTLCNALTIFEINKHPDAYIVLEDLADLYLKRLIYENKEKRSSNSPNLKEQALIYLEKSLKILELYFSQDSPHIKRIKSKIKTLRKEKAII